MSEKTKSKRQTRTATAKSKSVRAKVSKTLAAKKTSSSAKTSAATRRASALKTASRSANASASLPSKVITEKQSKAQIYAEIAEIAQISKAQAKTVLSAVRNLIERHVKPKGSGMITLPEIGIRVRRIQKKATKARMGRNPFTGEEIQIPAKPARKSIKVSALKALKAAIES